MPHAIGANPSFGGGSSTILALEATQAQQQRGLVQPRAELHLPLRVLDDLLGGFAPGRMVLLDSGSRYVLHLTHHLCLQALLRGSDVVYVDGGNSLNPHDLASLGIHLGLPREAILPRVRVARAFTAHQMAALMVESAEAAVAEAGAGLLVLSCLPELFLDEELKGEEAYHLLRRSLAAARAITEDHDTVTLVTNIGLAKLHRRRSLRNLLYRGVDRVVRIQQLRGRLLIALPDGRRVEYLPVAPNQRVLEDFLEGEGPRREPPRAAEILGA